MGNVNRLWFVLKNTQRLRVKIAGRGARRSALIWIKCADGSRFFKWLYRPKGGGGKAKPKGRKKKRRIILSSSVICTFLLHLSFFLFCAQGFSVSSYRDRARRTPAGWQTTPASLCTGELLRWTAAGGAVPEYVHIQWDGCVTVDQKCWVEVVACRCSDVVMGRAQHLSAAGGLEFFIIGDTIDNHLGLFRYVLRKPVVVGRSASQALQYRYVCLVLAAKFLLLFSFLAHVHRFRFCVFTLLRAARVSPETKKKESVHPLSPPFSARHIVVITITCCD